MTNKPNLKSGGRGRRTTRPMAGQTTLTHRVVLYIYHGLTTVVHSAWIVQMLTQLPAGTTTQQQPPPSAVLPSSHLNPGPKQNTTGLQRRWGLGAHCVKQCLRHTVTNMHLQNQPSAPRINHQQSESTTIRHGCSIIMSQAWSKTNTGAAEEEAHYVNTTVFTSQHSGTCTPIITLHTQRGTDGT